MSQMVIQFGFMSLFAVGFPGAAFFALLNNIQEMRSDAHKILNRQSLAYAITPPQFAFPGHL